MTQQVPSHYTATEHDVEIGAGPAARCGEDGVLRLVSAWYSRVSR
jgi:hypothetical protein